MFQLFKKRDFSDYVSDTFQFFRETGKHYLKMIWIAKKNLFKQF